MSLGISCRYLLLFKKIKIKKGRGVCQQYKQCVENESYTVGRGVEVHTIKMWKQHRSIHNYV